MDRRKSLSVTSSITGFREFSPHPYCWDLCLREDRHFMSYLHFIQNLWRIRSRDSALDITTGCGLDDLRFGVRAPVGSRILCFPQRPDRLWHQPNVLSDGYRGLFPGGKAAGAWSCHSSPTSAEVKKMWIYISTRHTPSWRSAQLVKHRNNFTVTLPLSH
jgi:hypothetical protein